MAHISLSECTCYIVKGRALGICQGRATHFAVLWLCVWGRSLRGNNAACLAPTPLSVTSLTSHKQIMPFQVLPWYRFPGRWTCVHSKIPWVPPMGSPVRLGVSPATATPTVFIARGFEALVSLSWNPGLHGLSHSPVVPPGLSACNVGPPSLPAPSCHESSLLQLPVSVPPALLDECFFNSLVVRLPYSSIFWHFWVAFCF